MSGNEYIRNRRRKLFDQDPHCYWCGGEVIWFEKPGGKQPPNAATIDHLYAKNTASGKRLNFHGTKKTLVLACSKCNNARSLDQRRFFPKMVLWWQSGSFPFPIRWVGKSLKSYRRWQKDKWKKKLEELNKNNQIVGSHIAEAKEVIKDWKNETQ